MTTAVADHVVAKVLESREYSGKFGPMKAYDLVFESGDVAELSQKPHTPAPQVGDALHGQFREEYGRIKFKKITPGFEDKDAKPATAPMPPERYAPQANTSMGSAPLPERKPQEFIPAHGQPPTAPTMNGDARQWSIICQHSQAMAIDFIRAGLFIGAITKESFSVALVRKYTEWFQAHAEGKNPPDYTP